MKKILVDAELSAPYLQEIKTRSARWLPQDFMMFTDA